jgi:hypothetical protein
MNLPWRSLRQARALAANNSDQHCPFRLLQSSPNVITFTVHGRVDLVRHLAIALVFLEGDVVRSRAATNFISIQSC